MSVFRRRIALRVAVLVASVSTVAGLLPAIAASPASAAAGPASIAFSTQPGDGDPGSPLAAQPVVTIKNGDGTTDTAATSTVTLTLNAVALKGSYVKGTLSLCTSTTTKGVATFTGCAVSAPGKYTLTATDDSDGLSFTSNPFYVSGPAQLVFTTQPGGGGAAASWSTQPVVTVEDAKGQPVADTHEVGLAIQGGTGPAGATLSCDTDGTAVNVVHFGASPVGQAAYAHCAIDKSGSGYSLYAVDPTDHLLSAPSSTFGITAGSVTQVVFGTEPAGATGGSPLPSQPVVRLEDAGGNVVTTATDHVTLAITATSGTAGAQLSCTALDVTATNGIATFAGCAIDKAGTGYTLTATDSTAVATAISTPFAITTGEASAIAFTTAPSGGTPGGPLGTQPVVAVTDAGGNPVSGAVTLSIASGTGPSGAVLTCATNPLGTSGAAATFSGCSIDQSGTYRLTATAGAHSVTSAGFTVHSGTAADVSFAAQPASTGSTGGATFATQPTVNVTDAGGQPAQGSVRLAIADGSGTPGAVLTCASNPVATVDATATFSGCSVDKAGNGYRLVATLVGTTAATTSTAFDVVVGAAAKLAFTSAPASGTGGIAAATQPVVTVEDAGGNPVSTATGTVTLTRTAGTGSGSLSCQDNIVALQLGRALFSGCSLDGVAAAYTLTATWQSLTAVSRPFAVTAGPATHLVVTHQPVGAAAGAAFATQPAVAFEDAGGNVTTTGAAPVTLSLTAGTGASGATLSSCGASTNGGTTTFSGCAISATGNGYTLTASGGGLTTETLPLAITATAPAVGTTPAGGLPVAETFGGQVYGANPTDIVDHVNTSTGSLTFSSTDLRVAGIGLPFLLARTYNSADRTGGSFGPGWSSLFDIGVTMVPGKTATVRGEDGQQLVWTWNTKTRSWVPPVGARGSLDCGGVGNHCRYTRTDGSMWDVNVTAPGGGQLQTYRAADGNGLTFDWSPGHVAVTVTSTSHKSYTVNATTNARGEVTSVTTPAGTTVRFGYDGAGELTSVTDAAGRTWTYAYTGGLLTRQSDGDGALRLAASYDTAGRVTTVSAKGAAQHTDDAFSYSAGVTTRRAHVVVGGALADAVYTYTYVGNSLVAQTEPSGATTRYAYDSRGNLVTVLDPLGWAQTMTYDADNDMTSQRTPVSTVTMTYDRDHRPLTTVDASGATTTDVYDGPFLAAIISPGPSRTPSVTWLKYNDLGELVLVIGPMGRQSFGYDAFGNRTSSHLQTLGGTALDGPGTLTTFDEAGDRLSATDADGNKTVWTYDHAGDKLTQRSPTGATTSYGYSGGGDLAQVSTGGQTTTYGWDEGTLTRTTTVGGHPTTEVYDPSGNLLRQLAGGATTTNAYDANGQLVMTTDASGVTTRYSYDLGGNAVLVTSSAGDVMSKQYDAVHRAVRQVLDGAVTLTSYDAAGHVVATTDASGRTTTSTYGPMGAVAAVTTTAGTTRYGYDADGNVTSVTDPNNHATTSSYDAANRLTASSVGGNTTRYGYDFAGNVTSIIDPDGRRTTYTLDALARPTTTTYSGTGGGYTVTQAYDALGRRTQMTDPSGTHTFTYDSAGDLTSAVHGADTFSYDYSTAGKIAETYPDGTPVTYTLDDAGNVMDVTSGQQGAAGYVQASYVRNAQRFTTALAYSNGVLETRQLTQSGQVLDQQLSVGGTAAADDRFAYNSGGERVSQVDNVAGQVTTNRYGYDGAGRLTGYSSATTTNAALSWPTVSLTATVPTASGPGVTPPLAPSTPVTPVTGTAPTAYTYDGNGNQLRAASGATYGYDAVDQLVSAAGPAGTTTSKYDHNGDLVSVTGPNGTETFTYDASGHLVGVRLPTGSTIAYAYDGDGNRISKTVGGVTTQYVWDPANASPQLAIERTASGSLIRRYFYGDGPVAMQTPAATFFYQLDPQGSVTELTDSSGHLAAAYHYDAYGTVTVAGANPPANPLLFQGGFLDGDTGLYDLGARNYDPTTGRFTQRDPLTRPDGTASMSPYVFTDDRPTVFTDPTGMFPTAAEVFWTHDTVAANGTSVASYGLTGLKLTYKGGKQALAFAEDPAAALKNAWSGLQKAGTAVKTQLGSAVDYVTEKFSSTTSTLDEVATNVGGTATAESEVAGRVVSDIGEAGVAAAEGGEALAEAGAAARYGGIALAVIGIGLQAFITVEDCMHDTVQKCVGDAVGTGVALAFIIGCDVLTEGAGAVVCGLAGAAIATGLQEVITRYGPVIASGLVTGYDATAAGLTTAGNAIAGTAVAAAGYVATGWNEAVSGVSTGFHDALNTLVNAGYSAAQLAQALASSFNEGVDTAVNALVGFGYSIGDVATALATSLGTSLNDAAIVLQNTFNYSVTQVAGALQTAYAATAGALGAALQGASYAVDQVAAGLKSAYATVAAGTDAAVATVLNGLSYSVNQIAGALQTVYGDADAAMATVLAGLNYTANQVSGALVSVYHDLDNAAASALQTANYTVNQIAGALKTVYDDAAATAANVLKSLGDSVNAIAGAMDNVYTLGTQVTAQILHNLDYTATQVAGALVNAYDAVSQDVTNALYAVGYGVDTVATALKSAFSSLATNAAQVASLLYAAGYTLVDVGTALKDTFDQLDAAVVLTLAGLSSDLNLAANAVGQVFNEASDAVASALNTAGYSVNQIAGVLQSVYADTAAQAAAQLQSLSASVSDMVSALSSVYGQTENQIASVLNGIGADVSQLASALEGYFNQAASAVAGVLSSIGISNSTIDAIGGAFSGFGNAVASGVSDAWNTVSSWF